MRARFAALPLEPLQVAVDGEEILALEHGLCPALDELGVAPNE